MLVADGVLPSNEGRGYVLRRLLRRAARHGKLLGIDRQFLYELAAVVINESKEAYPELAEKQEYIQKVIKIEEEKFEATIDQGLSILTDYIDQHKEDGKKVLPGDMVFRLHDTFGFPLDLTKEIAEENGLTVDEEGFRAEMNTQKTKAREAFKSKEGSAWGQKSFSGLDSSIKTEFVGYTMNSCEGQILCIIKDDDTVDIAQKGETITVILDRTPFYGESGGQVGDTGYIRSKDGMIKVMDCKKTPDGKYLHLGVVEKGFVENGSTVTAGIDIERRMSIAKNHTSTHLLQKALRSVLGEHVTQAGSLVEPDRLRFDFTHFSPMTSEELKRVENEVNDKIMENISVSAEEMKLDEARKLGAMALFGEKYGEIVRLIKIGNYSMELCGGTHLSSTGQAGLIKILGESGVASGVRRIEALTGSAAVRYFNERENLLYEIAAVLKTNPQDSVRRIEALMAEIKNKEKEMEQLRKKAVGDELDSIIAAAEDVKGIKVVRARFDQLNMEDLRDAGDTIKNKIGSGVVVLASSYGDKVSLVVTATKDVLGKGVHSGNVIKEIAKLVGGGGGGRPDMAQAGGKDVSGIDEALLQAVKVIEGQIKG